MSSLRKIAISVCTYQRPNQLRNAIKAIQELKIPYELSPSFHLVDNYPTDEVRGIFNEETKNISYDCKYFPEEQRGLVYARNRALLEANKAQCEFMTFFDDDDYPDEDWLINLWKCMNSYTCEVVSGKMIFSWPASCRLDEKIKELYDNNYGGLVSGEKMKRCATNNVLFNLNFVISHCLKFHPNFNLMGGEDSYFFELLTMKGGIIVRCNEAYVYSDIVEGRANEEYVWSRIYNIAYSSFFRESLLHGIKSARMKIIKLFFRRLYRMTLRFFSKKKKRNINMIKRRMEMKGMIDAFRGVKYQGYERSDGH